PPRHLPRPPVYLPELRRPQPRLRPLPARRRLRHHGRLLRPRPLHHSRLKGHHAHRPHHLCRRRPPHRSRRRPQDHRLRPRRCRHVRRGVPPPRPGRRLGPRRGLCGAVPVRRPRTRQGTPVPRSARGRRPRAHRPARRHPHRLTPPGPPLDFRHTLNPPPKGTRRGLPRRTQHRHRRDHPSAVGL